MASLLTFGILSASALAAFATQVDSGNHHRHSGKVNGRADGFVAALEFQHRLRVCNAYPYSAAMDVYQGKNGKVTGDGPLEYKTCRDFLAPLQSGDKLEFKIADASAGVFSVSDLPNNDAILLLVIHRHDTLSTAVAFESHVFANLLNAQVAVIDTFKGVAKGTVQIKDAGNDKSSRKEELRYNSVVAVNPGLYQIALTEGGETKAENELVALNRESYVILRTGVEAQQGASYPQELVVYPRSNPAALQGKAAMSASAFWTMPLVVAAFLHLC